MNKVIVHYHLRPGGIRRIIELAVPHWVREAPRPITRLVLATGKRADRSWHDPFPQQLPGVAVEVFLDRSFNYPSEQRGSPQRIMANMRRALEELPINADGGNCIVWAPLAKLSPQQLKLTELAGEKIRTIPTRAPGNEAPIAGLKVVAESGWFAARPAGTENIHRIYAESFQGANQLHRILKQAQTIINDALAASPSRPGIPSKPKRKKKP